MDLTVSLLEVNFQVSRTIFRIPYTLVQLQNSLQYLNLVYDIFISDTKLKKNIYPKKVIEVPPDLLALSFTRLYLCN